MIVLVTSRLQKLVVVCIEKMLTFLQLYILKGGLVREEGLAGLASVQPGS